MNEELQQRLDELEERIRTLEARATTADRQTTEQRPAAVWEPPHPAPPPAWPSPAPTRAAAPARPAIELDSETVLKWGGVGLVVLAVGFAVSTAISRGWIGPGLQLAGALVLSFALIAVGLRLEGRRTGWIHALCSGGVLALFTTFASDLFLDQADARIALAATAASAAIGAVLALRASSEWVGAATTVGGLVGWFTITEDSRIALGAAWVAVLGAVMIALAVRQGWHALRVTTHVAAGLSLLGLAGTIHDLGDGIDGNTGLAEFSVLAAAAALCASLAIVPSIGDLTSGWQQIELQLSIAAPPAALALIAMTLEIDDADTVGIIGLAVVVATALVALAVRGTVRSAHFASQVIGASVTLSIALGALLSADAAVAALAIQSAGLVVLARLLGDRLRVLINAGVLALIAAIAALAQMIRAWSDDASVPDDIAHLVVLVALAVGIWQTRHEQVWRLGALGILGMTMIWTGSVLVHLPQGQAAVSVSWAVIGVVILLAGAVRKMPEVGSVGLGVLAITVGKLLTVDLQEVDALWRALLFLVIGLALLRLGFVLPRLMGVDEPTDDDDADG